MGNSPGAILLHDLLIATKDGDWGSDAPGNGKLAYRVIRGADFPSVRVGDTAAVPLRYLERQSAERRTLQENDLIIETAGGSNDRPTGRTLLITQRVLDSLDYPATCASFCRFLRVDSQKIDPRYLFWFLQYAYNTGAMWEHQVRHTGIARFQYTKFAETIEVPLLGRRQQEALSEILEALDQKIELNLRTNRTLEAIARVTFKSWFVDFDPVRAGHPLFPRSVRNSTIGPVPVGWQVQDLGSVVAVNERSISRGYPYETIEYVDISSVSSGRLEGTTSYELSAAPSRARQLVASGDTIWSCVRPNRRSFLYIWNPPPNMVVSTGFAVLSPKAIPASYLYSWVTTDDFVDYLAASADGSAYPAVRPGRFAEARILVPSEKVLDAFHSLVGPVREKIAAYDEESRTLAALRDALLPKLLSGEIRVKQAEKIVGEAV